MKIMRNPLVFIATATLTSFATADTYRCDSKLVSTGDSEATVLMKCGEPMMRRAISASCVSQPDASTCFGTYQWTYNPGPGKFLGILTIEGGRLTRVERGDRVQ